MKKESRLLISLLLICFLLSGCGAAENALPDTPGEPIAPDEQDTLIEPETDPLNTPEKQPEPAELAAPVMEWWELYNPNGFDTVTAVIVNPNDVPIDVSYDLVYYKGGEEVARNEYFSNFDILPGHKDIIWANVDIPKSTDADDVKMENVTVSESYYAPIDGKYEYLGTADGEEQFEFTFESKPTLATITFLLYSDDNNNGQFDKGEIVVTSIASLTEQTGRVSFEASGYPYTDYEVFFTAY